MAAPPGEQQSHRRAEHGEDDAFGEQLPDQAAAVGAERESHSHLPAAGDGAGQQQIGDVRADDAEQQCDADHEREQRRLERCAHARESLRAIADVHLRLSRRELAGRSRAWRCVAMNCGTSRVISCSACASVTPGARRPRRSSQLDVRSSSTRRFGCSASCIEIGSQMSVCAPTISPVNDGGVDADDRDAIVVDDDRASDHRRIVVKAARPVAVADRRDRRAADRLIFAAVEHAAGGGRNAEHGEIVGGHESRARMFQPAGGVDVNVEPAGPPRGEHAAERAVVVAEVLVERIRDEIGARRALRERAHARRIADRRRAGPGLWTRAARARPRRRSA